MERNRPSGTAQGAAMLRALHRIIDDEPRILDDPIAARLLGDEFDRYKTLVRFFPFSTRVRANFIMRNRYAEDCLSESLRGGVRQYVLLGAGLDTFAFRQPGWASSLRIFEVDHPATQDWKRGRLAAANIPIPSNVTFVPVDFERISLQEGLRGAGLDFNVPTFFSSLGVTQYLTDDAFDRTLNFVLSLPPRSEIVFSFVLDGSALSLAERIGVAMFAMIGAARGEPWLTRYSAEQLVGKLKSMGFSEVSLFSTDAANARYFQGRRDGLRVSRVEQMMTAIV
ncbi:MAG TPA: class I SAM-dependent methyltransferase [Candidatus Binataceae bacterium]|nr:class I SAM-dependent methyltransferase [Candidatus Binataceae bacterium]